MSDAAANVDDVKRWLKNNQGSIMDLTPRDVESFIKMEYGNISDAGLSVIRQESKYMAVLPDLVDKEAYIEAVYPNSKLFVEKPTAVTSKQKTKKDAGKGGIEVGLNAEQSANAEEAMKRINESQVYEQRLVTFDTDPTLNKDSFAARMPVKKVGDKWQYEYTAARPKGFNEASKETQDRALSSMERIFKEDPTARDAFRPFEVTSEMLRNPDLAIIPGISDIEPLKNKFVKDAMEQYARINLTDTQKAQKEKNLEQVFMETYLSIYAENIKQVKTEGKDLTINRNNVSQWSKNFYEDEENGAWSQAFIKEYTRRPFGTFGLMSWKIVPDMYRKMLLKDRKNKNVSDDDMMTASIGGSKAKDLGINQKEFESSDKTVLQYETYWDFAQLLDAAVSKGFIEKGSMALEKLDELMGSGRAEDLAKYVPPQHSKRVGHLLGKLKEVLEDRDEKSIRLLDIYGDKRALNEEAIADIRNAEKEVMIENAKLLALQEAIKPYTKMDYTVDTGHRLAMQRMTKEAQGIDAKKRVLALANLRNLLESPKSTSPVGGVDFEEIIDVIDEYKSTNRLRIEDLPAGIQKQLNDPNIFTTREVGARAAKDEAISQLRVIFPKLSAAYAKYGPTDAAINLAGGARFEDILSKATDYDNLMPKLENVPDFKPTDYEFAPEYNKPQLFDLRGNIKMSREQVKQREKSQQASIKEQIQRRRTGAARFGKLESFPQLATKAKITDIIPAGTRLTLKQILRSSPYTSQDSPADLTSPFTEMFSGGLADKEGSRPDDYFKAQPLINALVKKGIEREEAESALPIESKETLQVDQSKAVEEDVPKEDIERSLPEEISDMSNEYQDLFDKYFEVKEGQTKPSPNQKWMQISYFERNKITNRLKSLEKETKKKLDIWQQQESEITEEMIPVLERRAARWLQFIVAARTQAAEKEVGNTKDKFDYENLKRQNPIKAAYAPAIDALMDDPQFSELVGGKFGEKNRAYSYRTQAKNLRESFKSFRYMILQEHLGKEALGEYTEDSLTNSDVAELAPELMDEFNLLEDKMNIDVNALVYLASQEDKGVGIAPEAREQPLASTFPILTPIMLMAGGPVKVAPRAPAIGAKAKAIRYGSDIALLGTPYLVRHTFKMLPAAMRGPTLFRQLGSKIPGVKRAEMFKTWGVFKQGGWGPGKVIPKLRGAEGKFLASSRVGGRKRFILSPARLASKPFRSAITTTQLAGKAATSRPGLLFLGAYFMNDPGALSFMPAPGAFGPQRSDDFWGLGFQAREMFKDIGAWSLRGMGSVYENVLPDDIKKFLYVGELIDSKASGMSDDELVKTVQTVETIKKTPIYNELGHLNVDPDELRSDFELQVNANHELAVRLGSLVEDQHQGFAADLNYLASMDPENKEHVFGKESPLRTLPMSEFPIVLKEKVRASIQYLPNDPKFGADVEVKDWINLTYPQLLENFQVVLSPSDIRSMAKMQYEAMSGGAGKVNHTLENWMFRPIYDPDSGKITREITNFGYAMSIGAAISPRILMETAKTAYYWYNDIDAPSWTNRIIARLATGDPGLMGDVDAYLGYQGHLPGSRIRQMMKFPTGGADWLAPWEGTLLGPVGRIARRSTTAIKTLEGLTGQNYRTNAMGNTLTGLKWGVGASILADSLAVGLGVGLTTATLSPLGRQLRINNLGKSIKKITDKDVLTDGDYLQINKLKEEQDILMNKHRFISPELYQEIGFSGAAKIAFNTAMYDTGQMHLTGIVMGAPVAGIAKIVNSVVSKPKIVKILPFGEKFKAGAEATDAIASGFMTGEWHQFVSNMRTEDFRKRMRGHFSDLSDHKKVVTAYDILAFNIERESHRLFTEVMDYDYDVAANKRKLRGKAREIYIRDRKDKDRRLAYMLGTVGIDFATKVRPSLKRAQSDAFHRIALETQKILTEEGEVPSRIKKHHRWKQLENRFRHQVNNKKMTTIDSEINKAVMVAMAEMLFPENPTLFFDLLDFKFESLGQAVKPEQVYATSMMDAWTTLVSDFEKKDQKVKATELSQALGDILTGPSKKEYYNNATFTDLKNTSKEVEGNPVDTHLEKHLKGIDVVEISEPVANGILAQSKLLTVVGRRDDVVRNKQYASRKYPLISRKIWQKEADLPIDNDLATERRNLTELQKQYDELDWAATIDEQKTKLEAIDDELQAKAEEVERFKREGPKEAAKELKRWNEKTTEIKTRKPTDLVKGSKALARKIAETEKMTDKAATKERITTLNQELRDAYIWSKLAVDVKEGIGKFDVLIREKTAELKERKKNKQKTTTVENQLKKLKEQRKIIVKAKRGHALTKSEAKALNSIKEVESVRIRYPIDRVAWDEYTAKLREKARAEGKNYWELLSEDESASPTKFKKRRTVVAINNERLKLKEADPKAKAAELKKLKEEYAALPWEEQLKGIPKEELDEINALPTLDEKIKRYKEFFKRDSGKTPGQKLQIAQIWTEAAKKEKRGIKKLEPRVERLNKSREILSRKIKELDRKKANNLFPDAEKIEAEIINREAELEVKGKNVKISERIRDENSLDARREENQKEIRIYDQSNPVDDPKTGNVARESFVRFVEDEANVVIDSLSGTWMLMRDYFTMYTEKGLAAKDYHQRKLAIIQAIQYFARTGKDKIYIPIGDQGVFNQLFGNGVKLGAERRIALLQKKIERNELQIEELETTKKNTTGTADPLVINKLETEIIKAEAAWEALPWEKELDSLQKQLTEKTKQVDETTVNIKQIKFDLDEAVENASTKRLQRKAKRKGYTPTVDGKKINAEIKELEALEIKKVKELEKTEKNLKSLNEKIAQLAEERTSISEARDAFETHPKINKKKAQSVLKKIAAAKLKYEKVIKGVTDPAQFKKYMSLARETKALRRDLKSLENNKTIDGNPEIIKSLDNALNDFLEDYFKDVDPTKDENLRSNVKRFKQLPLSQGEDLIVGLKEGTTWVSEKTLPNQEYLVISLSSELQSNLVYTEGHTLVQQKRQSRTNELVRIQHPDIAEEKIIKLKGNSLQFENAQKLAKDKIIRERNELKTQVALNKDKLEPRKLKQLLIKIEQSLEQERRLSEDISGRDDITTEFGLQRLEFANGENAMAYTAIDADGNSIIIQVAPTKSKRTDQITDNVLLIEDIIYENKPVGFSKKSTERGFSLQNAYLHYEETRQLYISQKREAEKVDTEESKRQVEHLEIIIQRIQKDIDEVKSDLFQEGYYDVLSSGYIGKISDTDITKAKLMASQFQNTIFDDYAGEPRRMAMEFLKAVIKGKYSGIAYRHEKDAAFGGAIHQVLQEVVGFPLDKRTNLVNQEAGAYSFIHFGTTENQIKTVVENYDANETRTGLARLMFDDDVASVYDAIKLAFELDGQINYNKIPVAMRSKVKVMEKWLAGNLTDESLVQTSGRAHIIRTDKNYFGLTQRDISQKRQDLKGKITNIQKKITRALSPLSPLSPVSQPKLPVVLPVTELSGKKLAAKNQAEAMVAKYKALDTELEKAQILLKSNRPKGSVDKLWHAVPGTEGRKVELLVKVKKYQSGDAFVADAPHMRLTMLLEDGEPKSNVRTNRFATLSGKKTLIINGLGTKLEADSYRFQNKELVLSVVSRIAREAAAQGYDAIAYRVPKTDVSTTNFNVVSAFDEIRKSWGNPVPKGAATKAGIDGLPDVSLELDWVETTHKRNIEDRFDPTLVEILKVEMDETATNLVNPTLFSLLSVNSRKLIQDLKSDVKANPDINLMNFVLTSKYKLLAHDLNIYNIMENGKVYDALYTMPLTNDMKLSVTQKPSRTVIHSGEFVPRGTRDSKMMYHHSALPEPISSGSVAALLMDPTKDKVMLDTPLGEYELKITKRPDAANISKAIQDIAEEITVHNMTPEDLEHMQPVRREMMDLYGNEEIVNDLIKHAYNLETLNAYERILKDNGYTVTTRSTNRVVESLQSDSLQRIREQRRIQRRIAGASISTRDGFKLSRIYETSATLGRIGKGESDSEHVYFTEPAINRIDTGLTHLDLETLVDGFGIDTMLNHLQKRIIDAENKTISIEDLQKAHKVSSTKVNKFSNDILESKGSDLYGVSKKQTSEIMRTNLFKQAVKKALYTGSHIFKLDSKENVSIDSKVAVRLIPEISDVPDLSKKQLSSLIDRISESLKYQGSPKLRQDELLLFGAYLGLDNLTATQIHKHVFQRQKTLKVSEWKKQAGDVEIPFKYHAAYQRTELLPILSYEYAARDYAEYSPLIDLHSSALETGNQQVMKGSGLPIGLKLDDMDLLKLNESEKDFNTNIMSEFKYNEAKSFTERHLPTTKEVPNYDPSVDVDPRVMGIIDEYNDGFTVVIDPDATPLDFLQANQTIIEKLLPPLSRKIASDYYSSEHGKMTDRGKNDFVKALSKHLTTDDVPPNGHYALMMKEAAMFLDKVWLRMRHSQFSETVPIKMMPESLDSWSAIFQPELRAAETATATVRADETFMPKETIMSTPSNLDNRRSATMQAAKEAVLKGKYNAKEFLRDLNSPLFDPYNAKLELDENGIHRITGSLIQDGTEITTLELYRRAWVIDTLQQLKEQPSFANLRSEKYVPLTARTTVSTSRATEIKKECRVFMDSLLDVSMSEAWKDVQIYNKQIWQNWIELKDEDIPSIKSGKEILLDETQIDNLVQKVLELDIFEQPRFAKIFSRPEILKERRAVTQIVDGVETKKYRLYPSELATIKQLTPTDLVKVHYIEANEAKRVLRNANMIAGFPMGDQVPGALLMPWDEFKSIRKVGEKYAVTQAEFNGLTDAFMDTAAPIGSYRNAKLEAAPASMIEGAFKSFSKIFKELSDMTPVVGQPAALFSALFKVFNKYKDLPPKWGEFLKRYEKVGNNLSKDMLDKINEFYQSNPDATYDHFIEIMLKFSTTLVPAVRPELLPKLYEIRHRMNEVADDLTRANPMQFEEVTDEGFLNAVQSIFMSDGRMDQRQAGVIESLSQLRELGPYQTLDVSSQILYVNSVTELQILTQQKINQVNLIGDVILKSTIGRSALEFNPDMPYLEQMRTRRLAYTLFYEGRFGPSMYNMDTAFDTFVTDPNKVANGSPVDHHFIERTGKEITTESMIEFLRDKGFGDYRAAPADFRGSINKLLKELGAEDDALLLPLESEYSVNQKRQALYTLNLLLTDGGPTGADRAKSLLTLYDVLGADPATRKKFGRYTTNPEYILADILVALSHHDHKNKFATELAQLSGNIDIDTLYKKHAIQGVRPISSKDAFDKAVTDQINKLMNMQAIPISERTLGAERGQLIRKPVKTQLVNEATSYDAFEPDLVRAAQSAAESIVNELGMSARPVGKTDNFQIYLAADGSRYMLPGKIIEHLMDIEDQALGIGKQIGKAGPSEHFRIKRQLDRVRAENLSNVSLDDESIEVMQQLRNKWEETKSRYLKKRVDPNGEVIEDWSELASVIRADKKLDRRYAALVARRQQKRLKAIIGEDAKAYQTSQLGTIAASLLGTGALGSIGLTGLAAGSVITPIMSFAAALLLVSAAEYHHRQFGNALAAKGLMRNEEKLHTAMLNKVEQIIHDRGRIHYLKELDSTFAETDAAHKLQLDREQQEMAAAQVSREYAEQEMQQERVKAQGKETAEKLGLPYEENKEKLKSYEQTKIFLQELNSKIGRPQAMMFTEGLINMFMNYGNITNNIKVMVTVGKFGLPYFNANAVGNIQQTHMAKVANAMNYGAVMGGAVGTLAGESLASMTLGAAIGVPVGQIAVGASYSALAAAIKKIPALRSRYASRVPGGASFHNRPKQAMGAIFMEANFMRSIQRFGFDGVSIKDYYKSISALKFSGAGLAAGGAVTALGIGTAATIPAWVLAGYGAGFLGKNGLPTSGIMGALAGGMTGMVVAGGPAAAGLGVLAGGLTGTIAGKYYGNPEKIIMRAPDEKFRFPPVITPEGKIYFADDLMRQAIEYGIGSSYLKAETGSEFLADLRTHHESDIEKLYSWFGGERYQQMMIEYAESMDKYYRYSMYFDLLESGHRPFDAAKIVRDSMLDYGQLTDFERGLMRNTFIFYSYMRRSWAWMTQILMENPDRVLGWLRLRRDLMNEAFELLEPDSALADYLQGRIPVSWITKLFGKKKGNAAIPSLDQYSKLITLFPSLPFEDNIKWFRMFFEYGSDGGEDLYEVLGSSLNPVLGILLPLTKGEQFFGGMDIERINVPLHFITHDAFIAGNTMNPHNGGFFFKIQGAENEEVALHEKSLREKAVDVARGEGLDAIVSERVKKYGIMDTLREWGDDLRITVKPVVVDFPTGLSKEERKKYQKRTIQGMSRLATGSKSNELIGNIRYVPATLNDAKKFVFLNQILLQGILSNKKLGPLSIYSGMFSGRYGQLGEKLDQNDVGHYWMGNEAIESILGALGGRSLPMLYKEGVEKYPGDRDAQSKYFRTQFTNLGYDLSEDGEVYTEHTGQWMFEHYSRPLNMPVEQGVHRAMGYQTVPFGVGDHLMQSILTDKDRELKRKIK